MRCGIAIALLGRTGSKGMQPHFHPSHFEADQRGFFKKPWVSSDCSECVNEFEPKEVFCTYSFKETIRGFHYYKKPGKMNRIITVITGEIRDVVFNISEPSPAFIENILNPESSSLYVPSDYAHGFEVLSNFALVHYLSDSNYEPENDTGFHWRNFPHWTSKSPIISDRDSLLPMNLDSSRD
jgi:dTDP-4-dehydrorhamnose 3,5-epimerase